MNAIAARAAPERDDPVARQDALDRLTARQDANRSAKHQRIGQIGAINGEGPIDGGDSHPIAVVANAGDHPSQHPPGMDDARRHGIRIQIRRSHAEHVGIADRLGAQAGAERIANHPAKTRIRTAVRVDRRGVVVGFDLETNVKMIIEPDDSGIITENTHQPIAGQLVRRTKDRLLEQIVDRLAVEADQAAERLVRTVLAPGLCHGFELAIRGLAADLGEVALDRSHLGETQCELSAAADGAQLVVAFSANRNFDSLHRIGMPLPQTRESERSTNRELDGVVGQHARDQRCQALGISDDLVGSDGANLGDLVAEALQKRECVLCFGIGHARFGHDMHDLSGFVPRVVAESKCVGFDDRVDKNVAHRLAKLVLRDRTLDQEPAAGADQPITAEPGFGGGRCDSLAGSIRITRDGLNQNMPEFRHKHILHNQESEL